MINPVRKPARLYRGLLFCCFISAGISTVAQESESLKDRIESLRRELAEAEASYKIEDRSTDALGAFFEDEIYPILEERCFECHGGKRQKGDLSLNSFGAMMRGGKSGIPLVVPGDPDASRMIVAIRRETGLKMPPDDPLPLDEIEDISKWVEQGAVWPGGLSDYEDAPFSEVSAAADIRSVPKATLAIEPGPYIDFDKDVLPVLADKCFACHGPDGNKRRADLRLDDPDVAFAALASGRTAVVAGDLDASQLFQRIAAESPEDRMPPADFTKQLTPKEIQTLGRWVLQGAEWKEHWAFQSPKKKEAPEPSSPEWIRNPIDAFVQARLEKEGLEPAPESDKRTLIRRVTLDLTGLPPTREDIQNFLKDNSPEAYERVVDRLLASPHYGEQMTRYWLDASRYADTNGYHIDNERFMWRWRDWVIDAYNNNMPFDQFTVEQLAGDLLPEPTQSQLIATGFNRNHMVNFEGGAIPEEYRVQYVVDRINTTNTVWMGLTTGCAQCHDHKYDPLTQKEFYQFFAFFNSIKERGLDGNSGNANPFLKAPLIEQITAQEQLKAEIAETEEAMEQPEKKIDRKQAKWEKGWREALDGRWAVLDASDLRSQKGAEFEVLDDGSIRVLANDAEKDIYEITFATDRENIQAIRVEALPDESLPKGGTGHSDAGDFVLTGFEVTAQITTDKSKSRKVGFAGSYSDHGNPDSGTEKALDRNADTGWVVTGNRSAKRRSAVFIADRVFGYGEGATLKVRLRHESKTPRATLGRFRISVTDDSALRTTKYGLWSQSGPYRFEDKERALDENFIPDEAVELDAVDDAGRFVWARTTATPKPDGVLNIAEGPGVYYLYREIESPLPRTVRLGLGSKAQIRVWLNGNQLYEFTETRSLKPDTDFVTLDLVEGKNRIFIKLVNPASTAGLAFRAIEERRDGVLPSMELLLALDDEQRTDDERASIQAQYRRDHWEEWSELESKLAQQREELRTLEAEIPTSMVMADMDTPRQTFMLKRGEYDKPTEQVKADTPAFLPAMDTSLEKNRLGLAQWLVDPAHPLTARVTVNRYWQQHFGIGLVRTSEDFGSQGERPVYPELLDWLAVTFVESGWDVKAIHRLMITSAAYRQSAKVDRELITRDPGNRLYARGPRFRLDAEMIRDLALSVSGLMVDRIGGRSVRPYQPPGLWKEVAYGGTRFTAQTFVASEGDDLHRRSMYTFWKRTAPPPSMMLFDAPNRETCAVRRSRSNTPLQALALMNDPQFVEAASSFAERIVREGGDSVDDRIAFAFELATGRLPHEREIAVLRQVVERQLQRFGEDAEAAKALIDVGDTPPPEELDPAELAAWTMLANMILNLDETITRG